MTTLREAATMALEALEFAPGYSMKRSEAITALKAALVEEAMQKFTDVNQELEAALGCEHCNQPLYAAVKCRVCGRVTEPVQEPVWVCPDSAEHRYQKPGHCEDCGKTLVQVAEPVQQGCNHCNQPLYAAIKCRVCGRETKPERNFCPRCGKRTRDIHTCTPPGDCDVHG